MKLQDRKNQNKGLLLVIILISITWVLGRNITDTNRLIGPEPWDWVLFFLKTLFLCAVLSALVYVYKRVSLDRISSRLSDCFILKKRVLFAVTMITALIFLIAYYPGTGSWDTWWQISDYQNGITTYAYHEGGETIITAFLNDHHPVATTALFSWFVELGKQFGDEKIGYFLFLLIQAAAYSFGYVKVCEYLQERGVGYKTSVLFYMFNPFLTYFSITMVKDSLYSIVFLFYLLCYIKAYEKDTEKSKSLYIIMLILSVILPLTKKTGIYIVIISNVILLIVMLKRHIKINKMCFLIGQILLPAVIMFFIFPVILFPSLQIHPGGKQETLATLFQQSARLGIDHPDAYSAEEKELLNRIFDYDAVEEIYDPALTDPVKNTFKLGTVTDKDLKDYYVLWLKKGLQHPFSYLRATAGTSAGYFSPSEHFWVYRTNQSYDFNDQPLYVFLRNTISSFFDWLINTPFVNLLSYLVIYCWWIPLSAVYYAIKKKGLKGVLPLAPVILSVLVLIVSPYSFARYALPLVLSAPLVLFGCKASCQQS